MDRENETPTDHYDPLGYRFTLSIPDAGVRAVAARMLAGFRLNADDGMAPAARYVVSDKQDGSLHIPDGCWFIAVNDALTDWYYTVAETLVGLERLIVTTALIFRTDLFHLHSAALVTPSSEQGILLVGESSSGKTTLALALMLRGFLVYSDDVAVIDPTTLALEPFPRAFRVDASTRALIEQLGVPPTWVFDNTSPDPEYFSPPHAAVTRVPARIALFLDRDCQPDQMPRLEPLAPAEAARLLLMNAPTLPYAGALTIATAARLTASARCYRLQSGDLHATVEMVMALVAEGRDGT